MIAVDSNILVYAHREDSQWHDRAYACLVRLIEGRASWAIPWPCVHEFLSVTTHPRIYSPPTPIDVAMDEVASWIESPSLVLLSESQDYWDQLRVLISAGKIAGPLIHDAKVAALCLQHGVTELWSADRDFGRFPRLKVRNPLLG